MGGKEWCYCAIEGRYLRLSTTTFRTLLSTSRDIRRRTLAAGAAWSVPAIALATAAPAFASSGPKPSGELGKACKQPGNSCGSVGFEKGYTFTLTITNNDPTKPIYIYGTSVANYAPVIQASADSGPVTFTGAALAVYDATKPGGVGALVTTNDMIAPNTTTTFILNGFSDDSRDLAITATAYVAWGHTSTPGGDTDHGSYSPKPPTAGYTDSWIKIGPKLFATTPPCKDCAP